MARYLIIGGSSGIGKALTKRLLAENHEVFILSRTDPLIPNANYFSCDVTKDKFPQLEGAFDGLVYCPGSINLKPFNQLTVEDFQKDFEVNCIGAVKVVNFYLPLLNRAHAASILFFSSVAVKKGMAFHASIAAAKGALEAMACSLAAEFSPKIRVNCIAPSLTETPLSKSLMRRRAVLEERHPLKRLGNPDDIAAMAIFLLSKESAWITGQVIGVDGGLSTLSVFSQ